MTTTVEPAAEIIESRTGDAANSASSSSSSSSPRDTLIASFVSDIHSTALESMSRRPVSYPSADPILTRDATYTADISQASRRYVAETGNAAKRLRVRFDLHDVPLSVPAYMEPLQTAVDIVNGTRVQTTATRTSGPSDFTGIAVPIVASLSDSLQRSYTWDFISPLARTLANLATIQPGLNALGADPDWNAGVVTAPAAIPFTFCTITYAQLGAYVNGTLATANCGAFTFSKAVTLVPLPRWTASLAQIGVAAWSLHTYGLSRVNNGTSTWFTGTMSSSAPAPTLVVFVVDDAPAANLFITGNPSAANATQLSLVEADWLEYLRFLRASIGDDNQLIRACVLVSASCRTMFLNANNTVADFDVSYLYHVNTPNALAFCLLHCSVVARPAKYFDCLPAGCWVAPVAQKIWFLLEVAGYKNMVSPYAVLLRITNTPPQQFVRRARSAQVFISDVLSHFGFFFDYEDDNAGLDVHAMVPLLSPNVWWERYGIKVTTPHGSMRWNAPRNGIAGPFSLLPKSPEESNVWVTAYASVVGGGGVIRNLQLSGPGAPTEVYPLPCDANGVMDLTEQAQLRPAWPMIGWCSANPNGTEMDTTYYTQTLANVALFNATGSVLPGLRVSGSEECVNLWEDTFLGEPEL